MTLYHNKLANTLSMFILASFILSLGSCKQSKAEEKTATENKFAGRWIPSWIPLLLVDDPEKTYAERQNLLSKMYFGTEINIPAILQDSVLHRNEDVEEPYKYAAYIENDTLYEVYNKKVSTKFALQVDGTLTVIDVTQPQDVRIYTFIKADSDLVKTADSLGISATRLKINELLAKNSYVNPTTGKKVAFLNNGKVEGLSPFVNFYINLNGDNDNIEDCLSIDFQTAKGTTEHLGFAFSKDGIRLYDLVLLTEPGEKPAYKTGKEKWWLKVQENDVALPAQKN